MVFAYKKYGPQILRPVIPIKIFSDEQSLNYEVLIDSGADICLFHTKIAEILGINLKKGRVSSISGVTGKGEAIYIQPLTVAVGDNFIKLDVGFLKDIGGDGYGIVGQKSFFEKFVVKFDLIKREIELIPKK